MLKKNCDKIFALKKKKDVSFWRFIAAPKRKLAPNIIDKQFNYFFLISGCAYIWLINERQRSKNTDIWSQIEKKCEKSDIRSGYLKL